MIAIKRVINFCKQALTRKKSKQQPTLAIEPRVYQRDEHPVSRQLISSNAQKVLYRLNKAGYDAYLVGGGVRDILLGIEPKDFDIATNATPEQIKSLFRNCRLIGRRFRLAHIVFGRDIIEVATFRGHHGSDQQQHCQKISKQNEHGMLLRDNIYGTIEEDAERRDFTVNALYYSVKDFTVHDFCGGVDDTHDRVIRLIGDPETRYREDPVRMLRAVRFAAKLSMTISDETSAPIRTLAPLMGNIPPARMFEEFLKLFLSGQAVQTFNLLREYHLFGFLFPSVDQMLDQGEPHLEQLMLQAMANTDQRIQSNKRVTPAFLLAAFLWYPLQRQANQLKTKAHMAPQDAFFAALNDVMSEQQRSIAIPKRFQSPMKDIWVLQDRLLRQDGKRAFKVLEHPKFRAGYDFLLLRAEVEQNELLPLANWWTEFQRASGDEQHRLLKQAPNARPRRRNPRKRHRAKPKQGL